MHTTRAGSLLCPTLFFFAAFEPLILFIVSFFSFSLVICTLAHMRWSRAQREDISCRTSGKTRGVWDVWWRGVRFILLVNLPSTQGKDVTRGGRRRTYIGTDRYDTQRQAGGLVFRLATNRQSGRASASIHRLRLLRTSATLERVDGGWPAGGAQNGSGVANLLLSCFCCFCCVERKMEPSESQPVARRSSSRQPSRQRTDGRTVNRKREKNRNFFRLVNSFNCRRAQCTK
ncbi:hypothetical protein HDK77DRAFT_288982 [Phyllosticta capitalensis]